MKTSICSLTGVCALALLLAACGKTDSSAPEMQQPSSSTTSTTVAQTVEAAKTAVEQAAKPYVEQITKAMDAVKALPASYQDMAEGKVTVQSLKDSVSKLKNVELDQVPADFKNAYNELANSGETLAKIWEQMPSKEQLAGLSNEKALSSLKDAISSGTLDDKASALVKQAQDAFNNLNSSRTKLTELAAKYLKP